MYDASKETDKDFLSEALKVTQEKIVFLEKKVSMLEKQNLLDEEICQKLSEELFLLKKKFYDSKQEKKANKTRSQEKRKKGKLPHNKNNNAQNDDADIELGGELVPYKIDSDCPKCASDKLFEMNNCFEESSEFEVVERRYILKRHQRQKYSCKGCNSIVTASGGVKLTPGGEFSIQIATQVACDKFEDHLPLERQRKQMKRAGVNVESKTLYGLTEHLYHRLYPLNQMILDDVLNNKWVHIDELPIDFYNPNKSKGYIWRLSNPKAAYDQFEPTRSGKVA